MASADIIEIKKIGRGKILVELKSYSAANSLISDQSLTVHNLKAFIPSYKAYRVGIIKDIPQDFDINEEAKYFDSQYKIVELHRLNRRVRDESGFKYVPSRTVCVKFEGQFLPKFVYVYKVRHSVTPFIPRTKICYACFRVGHVVKSCRSKPRCLFCGTVKHPEEEVCPSKDSPPVCINCSKDHLQLPRNVLSYTNNSKSNH